MSKKIEQIETKIQGLKLGLEILENDYQRNKCDLMYDIEKLEEQKSKLMVNLKGIK